MNGSGIHKLKESDKVEIARLYASGMSSSEIGRIYGVGRDSILSAVRKYGVRVRSNSEAHRKYSVNENAFDNLHEEEAGYWIGFLLADVGLNHKIKRIMLILKQSDKHHLEKFREFMGSNANITEFNRIGFGKEYPAVRICINSKKIYDRLMELGFDKQHKNTFPQWMTEDIFRHWLRGLIDGDGTVGITKATNGKKYLYVSLVGYPELVGEVENWLVRILGVRRNKLVVDKRTKIVAVRWEGSDAEKIADYIYAGAKVYLDRKYEVYMKWKRGEV